MNCCFIGHINSIETKNKIYTIVKDLMQNGVTAFYSRGRKDDISFEKTVKKCKGKLIFVPYNLNKITNKTISWYDDIVYPKRLEKRTHLREFFFFERNERSEFQKRLKDRRGLCFKGETNRLPFKTSNSEE